MADSLLRCRPRCMNILKFVKYIFQLIFILSLNNCIKKKKQKKLLNFENEEFSDFIHVTVKNINSSNDRVD